MSANTEIIENIQTKIARDLMPALQNAEKDQIDVSGEMIDIPQQTQARLKQKVNHEVVAIRTLLNQIQVT